MCDPPIFRNASVSPDKLIQRPHPSPPLHHVSLCVLYISSLNLSCSLATEMRAQRLFPAPMEERLCPGQCGKWGETAGSDLDQARQLSLAKHPAHLCCLLCRASLLCIRPPPPLPSLSRLTKEVNCQFATASVFVRKQY